MENPNKPEESQNLNSINMIEESKVSEQEIKNNPPIIKEEKIIINDNELKQINNNIENNQTEEMEINEMNIEKNSENNQNEQNSIKDGNENEEIKKEKTSLMRYPLAKIKNIMKLDNDIKLCQKDAYTVIGKLTEMFLQELARDAYAVCKSCKRKTINLEDINSAIKMNPKMGFINFNSIFYVEEINKIKKRPNSTKKKEINEEKKETIKKEKNDEEDKEKKKRGKSAKNKNNKTPTNNMTLDSMFGTKN